LGRVLSKGFVVHTSLNHYFTFNPPYLDGALPLQAPSLSSHFKPHHLCWNLTLGQIGKYDCVAKAFTPLAPTLASLKNNTTL